MPLYTDFRGIPHIYSLRKASSARFMNSQLNCTLCIRAHPCVRFAAKNCRCCGREGGGFIGVQTAPRICPTVQWKIANRVPVGTFPEYDSAERFHSRPAVQLIPSGIECRLNDARSHSRPP
jgi:hypothetical protein